jgi:CRISPR-associated protein Cmr4
MNSRILTLFTRTPLHVGAGASVGAIDQPIVRERHTGLPIIPGSSLKGVLADLWHADTTSENGKTSRVLAKDITWLFGSDSDKDASAGALSFGEARLLAFPIRSARGSFAWLTSPLLLARAARDGVPGITALPADLVAKLDDDKAFFLPSAPIALAGISAISSTTNTPGKPGQPARLVLEDYVFNHAGTIPEATPAALAKLAPDAPHFCDSLADRLVIISDGMLSFFVQTACEIAQHVRINDATGTADDGGLFNQENAPADTLFYAVLHATPGRSEAHRQNQPSSAFVALATRLGADDVRHTIQIGGDASTGLGFCTARLAS